MSAGLLSDEFTGCAAALVKVVVGGCVTYGTVLAPEMCDFYGVFCHIHASVECLGSNPALFFHRFCEMVNSITEEAWKGPEEGDCDNETLEVALSVLTCSVSTS